MLVRNGLALYAVVCVFAVTAGFAQESIHFASLAGTVTDPTGALISRANVFITSKATNIQKTSTTDSQGRFRFAYLPAGDYELSVQVPGFAENVRNVTLSLGAAFDLPVRMAVIASQSVVNVSSEPPVLETERSQIASTVAQREINTVPLNGRSFLDVASLLPGVSPTNTASTQLFSETSAVPGQGISINSQRNFSNSFVVDGLSASDDAAGLAGTFYGLGSIQELQVVTSGGQAEFGRAMGGYVNMVTKSGTNSLHGEAYGYFKNQAMNAANPLLGSKLPLTQTQYGGSIGGPIIRDRTFYFANFEQRLLNQDGLITVAQPSVTAINAKLLASGYPGSQIATGLYPNPVHNYNILGKIDHAFSADDNFAIRYSLYSVHSSNSRGSGGLGVVSAGTGLDSVDQTIAVSNVYKISSQTINETRGEFTNSDLKAPATDPVGPAVSISGVASFGTSSGSPTARYNRQFQLVDNLSRQMGAHSLRVGADSLYNDLTITYPRSIRGSYSFSSLASFLAGSYSTFTQTFGDPVVSQTNPNVGFYVQDVWRALPKLTINAGLRYDLQFLDTINTDNNNISPRIGIAWSLTPKTVVRAGAGLFYDRVPLRPLANALLSSDNTTNFSTIQQQSVSLAFGQAGAPVFPYILNTAPPNVLISFNTMNPNLQNAYGEQASLEIEQQLTKSATVNINYQHLRGAHLLLSINQNAPSCASSVDPLNLCRPNSAFQNNGQYSSSADSEYDALNISYLQRPTRWGAFRVTYTYSKALDDVGEFFFSSPINNFNVHQDRGRSDDDQRHRVVFNGYVQTSTGAAYTTWQHFSHGFQFGGILQYYSALPMNIVSGVNTIQQTAGRPCYGVSAKSAACTMSSMIGRNAGVGFDFFTLNLRLSRTFRLDERFHLQAIAESFNALNHRNDMIPNTTFGTGAFPTAPRSTFRQPTAVADPRTIQLALRLSF